jgi:hypothetical protein
MDNAIDPNIILEELCANTTSRTETSLRILNELLKEQSKKQKVDFSIATIGKLSKELGGPSSQTIRNRTGKHFQKLIETWAAYSGTTMKKPLSVAHKQTLKNNDQQILDAIDDPVMRAVVGSLIAERNKYRTQLNVIKANSDIVIDRTVNLKVPKPISSCGCKLSPLEAKSINAAISDEFIKKRDWIVMPSGQVLDANGEEVYLRGYINVLRKLLNK